MPSRRRTSNKADDVAAQVQRLADEYLAAYAPTGHGLSIANLRWTATRLLMYQSSGVAADTSKWPAGAPKMLAACLFVLIVQERLVHDSQALILGLTEEEAYSTLCSLLERCHIPRSELEEQVIEIDLEGFATALVQQRDLDALLFSGEKERTSILAASRASNGSVRRMVMTTLQFRYGVVFSVIFLAVLTWHLFFERPTPRVFYFILLCVCIVCQASIIPTNRDAESKFGHRYMTFMSLITACTVSRVIYEQWPFVLEDGGASSSYTPPRAYGEVFAPLSNAASARVHKLLLSGMAFAWWTNAILRCTGVDTTWRWQRLALVLDGAARLLSLFFFDQFGPPVDSLYPPDFIPLGLAVRQGCAFLLLALVLTPAMRIWSSQYANKIGLTHVRVPLSHVRVPRTPHDRMLDSFREEESGQGQGDESGGRASTEPALSEPPTEPPPPPPSESPRRSRSPARPAQSPFTRDVLRSY